MFRNASMLVLVAFVVACSTVLTGFPSSASPPPGDEIRWQDTLDHALRDARNQQRPVLIHFYGDNCPPCAMLEKKAFRDPNLIDAINDQLIAVRINADEERQIASRYKVSRWPTDVYLYPNGDEIYRNISSQDPATYEMTIERVAQKCRDWSLENTTSPSTLAPFPRTPSGQNYSVAKSWTSTDVSTSESKPEKPSSNTLASRFSQWTKSLRGSKSKPTGETRTDAETAGYPKSASAAPVGTVPPSVQPPKLPASNPTASKVASNKPAGGPPARSIPTPQQSNMLAAASVPSIETPAKTIQEAQSTPTLTDATETVVAQSQPTIPTTTQPADLSPADQMDSAISNSVLSPAKIALVSSPLPMSIALDSSSTPSPASPVAATEPPADTMIPVLLRSSNAMPRTTHAIETLHTDSNPQTIANIEQSSQIAPSEAVLEDHPDISSPPVAPPMLDSKAMAQEINSDRVEPALPPAAVPEPATQADPAIHSDLATNTKAVPVVKESAEIHPSMVNTIEPRGALESRSVPGFATGQPLVETEVALGGYCPVALHQAARGKPIAPGGAWIIGNPAFAVRHRGRIYHCSSEDARNALLKAPDAWTPVLSGCDLVEFARSGKWVDGDCQFGFIEQHSGRVYLFSSRANYDEFARNCESYSKMVGEHSRP